MSCSSPARRSRAAARSSKPRSAGRSHRRTSATPRRVASRERRLGVDDPGERRGHRGRAVVVGERARGRRARIGEHLAGGVHAQAEATQVSVVRPSASNASTSRDRTSCRGAPHHVARGPGRPRWRTPRPLREADDAREQRDPLAASARPDGRRRPSARPARASPRRSPAGSRASATIRAPRSQRDVDQHAPARRARRCGAAPQQRPARAPSGLAGRDVRRVRGATSDRSRQSDDRDRRLDGAVVRAEQLGTRARRCSSSRRPSAAARRRERDVVLGRERRAAAEAHADQAAALARGRADGPRSGRARATARR